MTISNFISISRILLLPLFVYYLSIEDGTVKIFALSAVIVFTDYLDGFLARKLNQVSEMGKILDPIADKLTAVTAGIGLVLYRDFPFWALAVVIVRDVLILLAGMTIIRKKNVIPVSNILGKITVTVLAFTYIAYILRIETVREYLLYTAVVLLLVSLVNYYIKNFKAYFS